MTEEDEEFNRIEREASMRMAAVSATVAKREWVGLSDGENADCIYYADCQASRNDVRTWAMHYRRAIEAKLREKNT